MEKVLHRGVARKLLREPAQRRQEGLAPLDRVARADRVELVGEDVARSVIVPAAPTRTASEASASEPGRIASSGKSRIQREACSRSPLESFAPATARAEAVAELAHRLVLDRDARLRGDVVEEDARVGRQRLEQRAEVAGRSGRRGVVVPGRRDQDSGGALLDGEARELDRLRAGPCSRFRAASRIPAGWAREPLDHGLALGQRERGPLAGRAERRDRARRRARRATRRARRAGSKSTSRRLR